MKINNIEREIIKCFFSRKGILVGDEFFSSLIVEYRELSGVGFLTGLERSEQLKIGEGHETYKFGDLGAKINASIDTGYLIYVENGFLDAIEGYTYGDYWPDDISTIDFYTIQFSRGDK